MKQYFSMKWYNNDEYLELGNVESIETTFNGKLLVIAWVLNDGCADQVKHIVDPKEYVIQVDYDLHELR